MLQRGKVLPVSEVGLMLKLAVLDWPGMLGTFARAFPAGLARALAGTPDFLPIWSEEWGDGELAVAKEITEKRILTSFPREGVEEAG